MRVLDGIVASVRTGGTHTEDANDPNNKEAVSWFKAMHAVEPPTLGED